MPAEKKYKYPEFPLMSCKCDLKKQGLSRQSVFILT